MELTWMAEPLKTQTWDWAFGQTPEFTYTLEHAFSWGRLVSDPNFSTFLIVLSISPSQKTNLHSKHGIILSCTFDIVDLEDWGDVSEVRGHLDVLEKSLAGEKYGFLKDEVRPREFSGDENMRQLWDELVKEMQN
jgi:lipoate-protein ligase A